MQLLPIQPPQPATAPAIERIRAALVMVYGAEEAAAIWLAYRSAEDERICRDIHRAVVNSEAHLTASVLESEWELLADELGVEGIAQVRDEVRRLLRQEQRHAA